MSPAGPGAPLLLFGWHEGHQAIVALDPDNPGKGQAWPVAWLREQGWSAPTEDLRRTLPRLDPPQLVRPGASLPPEALMAMNRAQRRAARH